MRTWFAVPLAFALALGACDSGSSSKSSSGTPSSGATAGGKTEAAPAAAKYKFDNFEAWNAFKEGSMIEVEMDTAGTKMKTVKTIDKKAPEEITLKTEMIMTVGGNEMKTPGTEPVKKMAAGAVEGNCALCGKPYKDHKDETKWTDETVKVGDKDVKCMVMETPAKNCKGDDMPKTKMWYSTEVPGHMVKMETAQMKMSVVKFDKK
ncbi:MAG TPA: hypothetical protein VE981_15085 [Planctomycetota bacterium]|nr:hypothetical protein [Planctomycetota bacterium]